MAPSGAPFTPKDLNRALSNAPGRDSDQEGTPDQVSKYRVKTAEGTIAIARSAADQRLFNAFKSAQGSREVVDVRDITRAISGIQNVKDRAAAQTLLMKIFDEAAENMMEDAAVVRTYLLSDPAASEEPNPTTAKKWIEVNYSSFHALAEGGERTRARKEGHIKVIKNIWSKKMCEERAFADILNHGTENLLRNVAGLARESRNWQTARGEEQVRNRINWQMYTRFKTKGARKEQDFMAGDFANATKNSSTMTSRPSSSLLKELDDLRLLIDKDGILAHVDSKRGRQSRVVTVQPQPSMGAEPATPAMQSGIPVRPRSHSHTGSVHGRTGSDTPQRPRPTSLQLLPIPEHSSVPPPVFNPSGMGSGSTRYVGQGSQAGSPFGSPTLGPTKRPRPTYNFDRESMLSAVPEDRLDDDFRPEHTVAQAIRRCRCMVDHIPVPIWSVIQGGVVPRNEKELKQWLGLMIQPATTTTVFQTTYCPNHIHRLAGELGIRHNDQVAQNLASFLVQYATEVVRGGRTTTQFKVQHSDRFTKHARPVVPSDSLGAFRFFAKGRPLPTTLPASLVPKLDKKIGVPRLVADFERDGNFVHRNAFSWLTRTDVDPAKPNEPLMIAMHREFDMYLWHQRRISGRNNLGWCRTMWYSVTQQLVRQDPLYWLIYVLVRPDHALWMISYPYYTKNQEKGDSNGFRHIDLRIDDMAIHQRGINQVQGSLSFDEEARDDCTEVVAGMHKRIGDWNRRIKEEGRKLTAGYIHTVDKDLLTDKDLKDWKLKWAPSPCPQGGVRLTHPAIPHGAPPAKGKRRTMLPWLVRINDDHEGLEVEESGTWSDLAMAHLTMDAPKLSPSGKSNVYGGPPFPFPAAVQLTGLGPVSDALVGRQKWNSPGVRADLKDWLDAIDDNNPNRFHDKIKAWRRNALPAFVDAIGKVEKAEKELFGPDKSFYVNKGNFSKRPEPDVSKTDEKDLRTQDPFEREATAAMEDDLRSSGP